MLTQEKPVGVVISGSLVEGFAVRLFPETHLEMMRTGKFLSIHGDRYRFFALIVDLKLTVSHPDILLFPPKPDEHLLKQILVRKDMNALVTVRPMLSIDTKTQTTLPVTTIPFHFALVYCAHERDIVTIFGSESSPDRKFFALGKPFDMQVPLCVDLEKITERSVGIFGKTGTGKTFVTRLMLAGIIGRKAGVCLIFDMHSEYGFQARTESQSRAFVKGLKTLFPQQIAVFSLDPSATRRRGCSPDKILRLAYHAVNVEDLLSLQDELNLHPTACEAAYLLSARYKQGWLAALLDHGDRLKELAQAVGAHPESITALYRKLKPIERLPFLYRSESEDDEQSIDVMMEYLDRGISIIIEFGMYNSTFCYLLIANIITRKIHDLYTAKTEKFLGMQAEQARPQQLVIVIEEAHKFLNPIAARQTIFGTIAREMRKYYVSLLIVDQRPSGIDPEVLSQVGTKLIAQLNDEKDIHAVLAGAHDGHYLRNLLSALGSRQQLLVIGHAIPMPMLIESRPYDDHFYRAIVSYTEKHMEKIIDGLY